MFKKLLKRRRKVSIKRKFILINLLIAVIPFLIFSLTIMRIYDRELVERTKRSIEDTNIIIADRIGKMLIDAENCSNYLTVNINRIVEKNYQGSDHLNKMTINNLITSEINAAKIIFKEIDSIAYLNIDNYLYYTHINLLNKKEYIFGSSYFKQLEDTTGKSIWFSCEKRDFLVKDKEEKVVTLGKKVWRMHNGDTLGYLYININIDEITKYLENQLIDYYLIDNNGNIITTKKELSYTDQIDVAGMIQEGEKAKVISYGGSKYLASKHKIEGQNWYIVGITDLNLFNMEEKGKISLLLILIVAIVVLDIMMSLTLNHLISAPIIHLKKGAEEIAEGNLNLNFNFKSNDEIGQLGNTFNYMSRRIKELLKKMETQEKKKREYELSLIQQQVKPHFLYNTLDIIIKLSEMGRAKDAQRVTKRLADYYRRSLSDSKEIISIQQEMKIVEDYLELQKIRYYDLFEYEIDIDDEVNSQAILKLTLQPLVENAIYHGIKYKETKGKILIKGSLTQENIIILISDNGIGIKPEDLSGILDLKDHPNNHFGIYSVQHRIKLFFGEPYGLEIKSVYQKGTEIKITLPKEIVL